MPPKPKPSEVQRLTASLKVARAACRSAKRRRVRIARLRVEMRRASRKLMRRVRAVERPYKHQIAKLKRLRTRDYAAWNDVRAIERLLRDAQARRTAREERRRLLRLAER